MTETSKGPKKDAVKNMREFTQKLREETIAKAKKKAEQSKPKKNERAAAPGNRKRQDLDL